MWFVRDSALAGTAFILCFNALYKCSTSVTNQPTNQPRRTIIGYKCFRGYEYSFEDIFFVVAEKLTWLQFHVAALNSNIELFSCKISSQIILISMI